MRIPVSGATLACEVFGSGEPVVFAHGFPIPGLMWHHAAARLPPGFRGIVPDLRGHRESTVSPSLDISTFTGDLIELLDTLAPGRPAIFVGLSMGGMICMDVWRRHASRVRAMVLCNTRPTPESPEGVTRRHTVARLALEKGSAAVVDTMIPQVFSPTFETARKAWWRDQMAATSNVTIAAAALALSRREDSVPLLPTITCPTHLVAGEHDAITPPTILEDMHRRIPGSTLVQILGSGHVPPVEQPDLFSTTLNAFLQSLA